MQYKQRTLFLIVVLFCIKLIAASLLELGNDEVYYWTYAEHLQANYFDHPGMIAFWIRAFTLNLHVVNETTLRVGSLLSCALATWVLFKTVSRLHSEKAGFYAAVIYNCSFYAGIIAGTFVMPDAPQMLFWTLALWCIANITEDEKNWGHWLLLAVSIGLAILSKVHGVFLWIGFGLFILLKKRNWLRLPQLYVAFLISMLFVWPIIQWNIANDFITYRYHSQRVSISGLHPDPLSFFREFFGEFIYTNPIVFVLLIIAFIREMRRRTLLTTERPALSAFHCIALPMIGILLFVSAFRSTFPHWSGPGFVTLVPFLAISIAQRNDRTAFFPSLRWALGLFVATIIIAITVINYLPATLGNSTKKARWGEGDFTLDLYGWRDGARQFSQYMKDSIPAFAATPNGVTTPIMVSNKWFPAAHEEFYFCRPLGLTMIGLGTLDDIHNYAWLNAIRFPTASPEPAYCVVPSNLSVLANRVYRKYYTRIDSVHAFPSKRSGAMVRYFTVYRLSGWKRVKPPMEK